MSRRNSREIVLKSLFSLDFTQDSTAQETLEAVVESLDVTPLDGEYAKEVLDGVLKYRKEIDGEISQHLKDWTIERLSAIDRNLLRMATYEMFYAKEKVAPAVVINEAVDIAKEYGTDESAPFINGVLGKMVKSHG